MSSNDASNAQSEREIEEDVMNVPFIAWLGAIATILIAVSVLLLTGVYYLTQRMENERRNDEADARITDLEAQRIIDAQVVDGFFKNPDAEDDEGNVVRGTVNLPVELGMRQVVENANR